MGKKIRLRLKGRFALLKIKRKKFLSGGFVFIEFAIALPLLILLAYGMATLGTKIFYLGKTQLADYVLEEEVHDVLSRFTYDARAAKIVTAYNNPPMITFNYRTINEKKNKDGSINKGDVIADTEKIRVYMVGSSKIYYERQTEIAVNPITGDNFFGLTRVTEFKFSKLAKNVLHVTLEMQSEQTQHKIKISTAIYIPGCENLSVEGS